MGIRRRRRDLSCLKDGTRGNEEVIDISEEIPITFRGGRGRGYGRRGRGNGRGRRQD